MSCSLLVMYIRVHPNTRASAPQRLGDCLHILQHAERVIGVARLNQRRLASASIDGHILISNVDSGAKLHSIKCPSAVLSLGAADSFVAAGLQDGRVVVYDAASGSEVLAWSAHPGGVTSLHFPHQGRLLTGALYVYTILLLL
jgi:WD40 repeat protein